MRPVYACGSGIAAGQRHGRGTMAQSGWSGDDLGLFTDLYELTMAQVFFEQGMFAPATFSLFVRNHPPNRGYLVFAGLEDLLEYLEGLGFDEEGIDYLRAQGIFSEEFLEYLAGVRFTGSVRAMEEGRLFFAGEPILEVTAPIIEAQLAETYIINQVNLQSLQATKAARCAWAAQGRRMSDFGSRRAHGVDAALKMARSGYIGGFESTSNVLAAKRYGIPAAGTMGHSFVSSFSAESLAFEAYARSFPGRTVLLLDTYDTIAAAYKAAETAKELEARGQRLAAVRLDSGDLEDLSRRVRQILDEAGLSYVEIMASGGLDEGDVERLIKNGAPINVFGLGTKVTVSADAPWSDMVYKLVQYHGQPVMKLSEDKAYLPGAKQVFRFSDAAGRLHGDAIGLAHEAPLDGSEPLLVQVMTNGRRIGRSPALPDIRDRFRREFEQLPNEYKKLESPPDYPVSVSDALADLTRQVEERAQEDTAE